MGQVWVRKKCKQNLMGNAGRDNSDELSVVGEDDIEVYL
jgi:hypothetical protein